MCPIEGGPLALNDLIAGQIQLIIEVSPVVNEQVRAGTIRGFAVSSPTACRRCPTCRPSPKPECRASWSPAGSASTDRRGCRTMRATNSARHRRGGQGPGDPEEVPRHRLRARPGRAQGVHRAPCRRGEALGGVLYRNRPAEIGDGGRQPPRRSSRCAASASCSATASWRSTASISTCARANSCRCSGRPAAASRRRCASSRA